MFKKILSIIITVLILSVSATVSADSINIESIDISYLHDSDSVVVSGVVDTSINGLPMSMTITYGGVIVAAEQTYAVADDTGKSSFKFEPILLSDSSEAGPYTVHVYGRFVQEKTAGFAYYSTSELFPIVKNLCDKINADDFSGFINDVALCYEKVGIDYLAYQQLGDKGKLSVSSIMTTKNYELNSFESYSDNTARRTALRSAMGSIDSDFGNAVQIGKFNDISDTASYLLWESMNKDIFDATKDSSLHKDYYEIIKSDEAFGKHIGEFNSCLSMDEVLDSIYEAALLTLIETKQNYYTKNIFESFSSKFDVSSVNISTSNKEYVYPKVSGSYYKTAADAVAAFVVYAAPYVSGNNPPPLGGNDSGSSGSWGGTGGMSVVTSPTIPPTEVFTDLGKVEWAKPAIMYLYEEGIVNGYGKEFMPMSNVTRAEFVKMIVSARELPIETQTNDICVDVYSDDWYAPYVSAAMNAGIVFGNDNGEFMPSSNITRQDMAVIICRAFSISASGNEEAPFDDMNLVNDYAKDSVTRLFANKIISGMGNGLFAPVNNATRAESTQIIYNVLNFIDAK